MSEILDRLDEIERRVANLKDWKQKYEEEKQKREEDKERWNQERQEYIATIGAQKGFRDALLKFLDLPSEPRIMAASKETLNLTHKELVVNLGHEEKELNLTTGTVVGRVLFCALTDLHFGQGFNEAQLVVVLLEHGWNIPHNTLAPTLGGLVKEGYLMRLAGRPAKYRLPNKVKINVRKEGGEK